MCGCLSVPPTGDLACTPGMCPDWESNQQPFGSQASAHSTEPHQAGQRSSIFTYLNELCEISQTQVHELGRRKEWKKAHTLVVWFAADWAGLHGAGRAAVEGKGRCHIEVKGCLALMIIWPTGFSGLGEPGKRGVYISWGNLGFHSHACKFWFYR